MMLRYDDYVQIGGYEAKYLMGHHNVLVDQILPIESYKLGDSRDDYLIINLLKPFFIP